MKTCLDCLQHLDLAMFYKNSPGGSQGVGSYCRPCTLARRRNGYEALSQRERLDLNLRRAFGIGVDTYDEFMLAQDGVCAICAESEKTFPRLVVDHDHETGKIRGLLCSRCNIGLGTFKDSPQILRAAANYLDPQLSFVRGSSVTTDKDGFVIESLEEL